MPAFAGMTGFFDGIFRRDFCAGARRDGLVKPGHEVWVTPRIFDSAGREKMDCRAAAWQSIVSRPRITKNAWYRTHVMAGLDPAIHAFSSNTPSPNSRLQS